MSKFPELDFNQLAENIKAWGKSLGFQQVGICDIDLSTTRKVFAGLVRQGLSRRNERLWPSME